MTANKKLFFNPDDYFAGLLQDIGAARREIILETYIFKLDSVGQQVLDALIEAAGRGVVLRLLIDGIGSYRDAATIAMRLEQLDCELRVFHPLPWDFALYRRALRSEGWYAQLLYLIASINHRDHRKLCILDGQLAWLGSYNITADHHNPESTVPDDYWHDTGLRAGGAVVEQLADNFNQVWSRKRGSIPERSRRFLARAAMSQRRRQKQQLLQLLNASRQRIWITNAYFNPSGRLLQVLKRQARSGIDVRLIVPARSDVVFFPVLSRSFYADLLQAGIQVFEYRQRVLHSKTMLIDKQLLLGSTNLNFRSLFHDLELDVLLDEAELISQMQQRFETDLTGSVEISARDCHLFGWKAHLQAMFARFLRYWL